MTPLKATADTFVKSVPVMVTVVPVTPEVGEKAVTVCAIKPVEAENTIRSIGNSQLSPAFVTLCFRIEARLGLGA